MSWETVVSASRYLSRSVEEGKDLKALEINLRYFLTKESKKQQVANCKANEAEHTKKTTFDKMCEYGRDLGCNTQNNRWLMFAKTWLTARDHV